MNLPNPSPARSPKNGANGVNAHERPAASAHHGRDTTLFELNNHVVTAFNGTCGTVNLRLRGLRCFGRIVRERGVLRDEDPVSHVIGELLLSFVRAVYRGYGADGGLLLIDLVEKIMFVVDDVTGELYGAIDMNRTRDDR